MGQRTAAGDKTFVGELWNSGFLNARAGLAPGELKKQGDLVSFL